MVRGSSTLILALVAGCLPVEPSPRPDLVEAGPTPVPADVEPAPEPAPEPPPPLPPRERPISSDEIRGAHERAQEIVLGSNATLPTELSPADADVHGRYTPLFEPPGSDPMQHFHSALDRLEAGDDPDGKVRVLVYGASGTAADRWTGYLRAYLQARFGDGGPGFVPLGKHSKWSRHQEYSLDSSSEWLKHQHGTKTASEGGYYGLLGAALAACRAGASCELAPARGSVSSRNVTSFELWYLAQPNGGAATALVDGRVAAQIDTRANRVHAAYELLTFDAGAHTLGLRTNDDDEVRTFGVVAETDGPGVVVDSLGVVGAHASAMLNWDEALWAEHAQRRDPSLFLFAFGTNEAFADTFDEHRFAAKYGEVVARLRRTLPDASCVLMSPGEHGKPGEDELEQANLAIVRRVERDVAADYGCALWDGDAFMNGPGGMEAWVTADPPLAAADYVHTTSRGAVMTAMAVADALMWGYDATRVSISAGGL